MRLAVIAAAVIALVVTAWSMTGAIITEDWWSLARYYLSAVVVYVLTDVSLGLDERRSKHRPRPRKPSPATHAYGVSCARSISWSMRRRDNFRAACLMPARLFRVAARKFSGEDRKACKASESWRRTDFGQLSRRRLSCRPGQESPSGRVASSYASSTGGKPHAANSSGSTNVVSSTTRPSASSDTTVRQTAW